MEILTKKHILSPFRLIVMLFGALLLLFVLAPLLGMFFDTSFSDIFQTAAEKEVRNSISLTLSTAFVATIISAIFAIPFAWLLARKQFRLKPLVTSIIDLPIVIPHTAAGIAVLGLVSRDSVIGKAGAAVGIDFIGNPAGISVAMAFVSIPFLINAARDGFEAVPERLEKAAINLGASPFRVFFSISLPLAWRSIVSGLVMMFARGMSEFGAIVIIAYHPMIAPVMIFERFSSYGLKYATPVSIVFIVVSLVFFVLLRLLSRKKKDA